MSQPDFAGSEDDKYDSSVKDDQMQVINRNSQSHKYLHIRSTKQ